MRSPGRDPWSPAGRHESSGKHHAQPLRSHPAELLRRQCVARASRVGTSSAKFPAWGDPPEHATAGGGHETGRLAPQSPINHLGTGAWASGDYRDCSRMPFPACETPAQVQISFLVKPGTGKSGRPDHARENRPKRRQPGKAGLRPVLAHGTDSAQIDHTPGTTVFEVPALAGTAGGVRLTACNRNAGPVGAAIHQAARARTRVDKRKPGLSAGDVGRRGQSFRKRARPGPSRQAPVTATSPARHKTV